MSIQNGVRIFDIANSGWHERSNIPYYYGFGDYENELFHLVWHGGNDKTVIHYQTLLTAVHPWY